MSSLTRRERERKNERRQEKRTELTKKEREVEEDSIQTLGKKRERIEETERRRRRPFASFFSLSFSFFSSFFLANSDKEKQGEKKVLALKND